MQNYRPDIDGLRAIAVGTVVLCHAAVPGFSGGFLGVDVFFVISGYLITQVLVGRDGTLKDTIGHFYERRVRRIVPALALVLLACTAAALVMLSPYELREYASSLMASVGFVSNFQFMRYTAYFAPHIETPLLHLWSLSVEEQFYVAYPLFLWAMQRYAPRFLLPVLVGCLVVSLALSEWLSGSEPKLAFYFTGSRAWELLLGSVVALAPFRRALPNAASETLAALAVLLILTPVLFFDSRTAWPGLHALLPCAGTAMLLALHDGRPSMVSRILSTKPLVAVGLISYSLYLWHWPIFEFFKRWVLRPPTVGEYAVLIAISVAAAALSWRFVEQPFRRIGAKAFDRLFVFRTAGACGALLLATGLAADAFGGWPARFPHPVREIYAYLEARTDPEYRKLSGSDTCFVILRYPFETCFRPAAGKRNVVLWGDSMAQTLFAGLRERSAADGVHVIQAGMGSCRPTLANEASANPCAEFNRGILKRLDHRISAVIITGLFFRHEELIPGFYRIVRAVAAKGTHVIVIGPAPGSPRVLPFYLARYAQTHDPQIAANAQAAIPALRRLDKQMKAALTGLPGVTYVSFLDIACEQDSCPLWEGETPLLFDHIHFTIAGSRKFGALLWPRIRAILPSVDAKTPH